MVPERQNTVNMSLLSLEFTDLLELKENQKENGFRN